MRAVTYVMFTGALLMSLAGACSPVTPLMDESSARQTVTAETFPSGTFTAIVPGDQSPIIPEEFGLMAGTWHITLVEDGSYRLYQENVLRVEGEYAVMGDQIEFHDLYGAYSQPDMPGVYQWILDDGRLRFQTVADAYAPRSFVLTCMQWKRV